MQYEQTPKGCWVKCHLRSSSPSSIPHHSLPPCSAVLGGRPPDVQPDPLASLRELQTTPWDPIQMFPMTRASDRTPCQVHMQCHCALPPVCVRGSVSVLINAKIKLKIMFASMVGLIVFDYLSGPYHRFLLGSCFTIDCRFSLCGIVHSIIDLRHVVAWANK